VTSICLIGPESSGKTSLAEALAAHFNCPLVPEFARDYCAVHGGRLSMEQLVHVGQQQDAMIVDAQAEAPDMLIIDTDAIFTSVWVLMQFGAVDPWFEGVPARADVYLLLKPDLPFVQDGARVYESFEDRAHFHRLCMDVFTARGAKLAPVEGEGPARLASALAGIEEGQNDRVQLGS
jgi:NadR type nicotinamide-nucleotide adenylyltransferase